MMNENIHYRPGGQRNDAHQGSLESGRYQRKIRVLHIIAHVEKAGAERQLALLAGASAHDHVIAVLKGNEAPSPAFVETFPSLSPLSIYQTVRDLIGKHQIEIVQLWLPDRITIPAMLAARAKGCPIISGDRRRARNHGLGAIRDRLTYLNHLFADLVVPNYPHILPRLSLRRFLCIPGRTRTIANGIKQVPVAQKYRGRPDRLLFVGRFVEQKRRGELIDLMPALLADTGVSGLDIVGEGPLDSDYRDKIHRNAIGDHVVFHGRLKDWGTRFLPEQNMLILPSVSEGMSNTLFEAIAYGFLPLISHSYELEEMLKTWPEKPERFDPWDSGSILSAVKKAFALPPERIEARVQAMQKELTQFSVKKMAASYDSIYELLAAGKLQR